MAGFDTVTALRKAPALPTAGELLTCAYEAEFSAALQLHSKYGILQEVLCQLN